MHRKKFAVAPHSRDEAIGRSTVRSAFDILAGRSWFWLLSLRSRGANATRALPLRREEPTSSPRRTRA